MNFELEILGKSTLDCRVVPCVKIVRMGPCLGWNDPLPDGLESCLCGCFEMSLVNRVDSESSANVKVKSRNRKGKFDCKTGLKVVEEGYSSLATVPVSCTVWFAWEVCIEKSCD